MKSLLVHSAVAVGLLLLLALLPAYTHAQDTSIFDAGVLKDVGPLHVFVNYANPDFEGLGLRRDDIQRDVELKLRLAGITIGDDFFDYLYVNVSGVCPSDSGVCGYGITVDYNEVVFVLRGDEYRTVISSTWDAVGETGTVGSGNLASIRDGVKDMVDEFVNAYLTANPKL